MQVVDDLSKIHIPLAATIGNFDGVHLGHQALIQRLVAAAKQRDLPSGLITFEPTPQEFFQGSNAPARLTRLEEKNAMFDCTDLDYVVVLPFDGTLADLSAERFVTDILLQQMQVEFLLIGDDFKFGKNRLGNFALLQSMAKQYDFSVDNMPSELLHGERISSSRIRAALQEGDLATAERLLGRPYSMLGTVVQGDQRGRSIGFPTANILLQRYRSPLLGVFAVRVYGIDKQPVNGVANVGSRPTVDGTRSLLEVHLFEFDHDIYGQALQIEFCHKIRDEQRFDSFELLKQQIQQDCQSAVKFFST